MMNNDFSTSETVPVLSAQHQQEQNQFGSFSDDASHYIGGIHKYSPSTMRTTVYWIVQVVTHAVMLSTGISNISLLVFRPSSTWSTFILKPIPNYCTMIVVACNLVQFSLNYRHILASRLSQFLYIYVAFAFQMLGLFIGSLGDIFLDMDSVISDPKTAKDLKLVFFGLGVFSFLIGHLCYVVTYSVSCRQKESRGPFSCFCNFHLDVVYGWLWMIVVLLFVLAMFVMLVLHEKSAILAGLVVYMLVSAIFLWKLAQTQRKRMVMKYGQTYDSQYSSTYGELFYQHLRVISAVMFVVSDSTIAINMFVTPLPAAVRHPLIMGLYYLAQYGIGLSFNEFFLSAENIANTAQDQGGVASPSMVPNESDL